MIIFSESIKVQDLLGHIFSAKPVKEKVLEHELKFYLVTVSVLYSATAYRHDMKLLSIAISFSG
jgi:hypothetical protein